MESSRDPAVRPTATPETWRRVKTIAGAALDRPGTDRDRYIDDVCAGDDALRLEVLSLLRATVKAEKHFETPAGALAIDATPVVEIGGGAGPYRLVRALGTGGMGAVYLAERFDGEFEQRVAVKVVRGGFGTPFMLERFREERRILASLEHPNIARLIDGGTTDAGLPYVAMEYVEGEPIDVFCRTQRLKVRRRLEIFRHVCAAVHYAHQHLVVHRDIKAGNILVTADGIPKLLDFGIAKLTQPGLAEAHSVTRYRVVTPESASPEQLQGRPITIATDVYALGVLLFRLLAGQSPYGPLVTSETDLIRAVCEQTPDAPSVVVRRVRDVDDLPSEAIPLDLDVIVMKAMRKEPERRYGSVDQLSEDVRRYLEGRPVLAAPDSVAYRTRKFLRRHRVAMLGTVGIVVALAAGIVTTLWQTRVAYEERARAERQFTAVRTLATSVLGELYDAVNALEGSLPAREILLRRATEYLDALAREAGDNVALRREVADGYLRLGNLQGSPGFENLGDRAAAKRSIETAAALLEPLASGADPDPQDRLKLADILLSLHSLAAGASKSSNLQRAKVLLEGVPGDMRAGAYGLALEALLWHYIALQHTAAKDYPRARDAYTNELRAAEAAWRLAPTHLPASRNLSLAYKQLGAVLQVLRSFPEARALFDKALALDRARVEREPGRYMYRLDLSFSLGSIGALLQAQGDLEGAYVHYQQAVELRKAVVESEPTDEFARGSLARGYDRLALIEGRRGRLSHALEWHDRRVQLYLAELKAHPERDGAWRDYAQTAFGSVSTFLDLMDAQKGRSQLGRAHRARLAEMLETLVATRSRWVTERRSGELPPSDADMRRAAERLQRLRH
jgi:non-specific serine/threonine protein kinase/serine/threonine-protein kinase